MHLNPKGISLGPLFKARLVLTAPPTHHGPTCWHSRLPKNANILLFPIPEALHCCTVYVSCLKDI